MSDYFYKNAKLSMEMARNMLLCYYLTVKTWNNCLIVCVIIENKS